VSRELHGRFSAQAALWSFGIAVECGAEFVSYPGAELQASRMAWSLRTRGADFLCRVGLVLPPSCETLVAMLAVLKTGAVCVPVAPGDEPSETRKRLVAAGVDVLLTSSALYPDLQCTRLSGLQRLLVDADRREISLREPKPIPPDLAPRVHERASFLLQAADGPHDPEQTISHDRMLGMALRRAARLGHAPEERVTPASPYLSPDWLVEAWAAIAAGATLSLGPSGKA
jgi:acyl-CoA synthetase (AMP-forming)/AMP-acid ligase II